MPETVPPLNTDAPRPLPRRPVPSAVRANRPRFQPLDAVWMVVLAALSLAVTYLTSDRAPDQWVGTLSAGGTVAGLYLLGWRARDRAAGVGGALLAATSLPYLHAAAYSSQSAPFALLTVAALFALIAGSSLAALSLAAFATLVRPDGLLLGLLLLGLAFAQHRKRALIGAALFFGIILMELAARFTFSHEAIPVPPVGLQDGPWRWLSAPAAALLAWFLLPLCAEWSEPVRRARWLPVVVWAVAYFLEASLLKLTTPAGMLLPLLPLLFALAGGGLSRLLPTLSGEIPTPALRYVLAVLAVTSLAGLHVKLEAPTNRSAAPGRHTVKAPAALRGSRVQSGN